MIKKITLIANKYNRVLNPQGVKKTLILRLNKTKNSTFKYKQLTILILEDQREIQKIQKVYLKMINQVKI